MQIDFSRFSMDQWCYEWDYFSRTFSNAFNKKVWNVEGKYIYLVPEGSQLQAVISDDINQVKRCINVPVMNGYTPIQTAEMLLSKYEPALRDDGSLFFSYVYCESHVECKKDNSSDPSKRRWYSCRMSYSLALLKNGNNLMWRISKISKKNLYFVSNTCYFPSKRCGVKSTFFINSLKNRTPNEMGHLIKANLVAANLISPQLAQKKLERTNRKLEDLNRRGLEGLSAFMLKKRRSKTPLGVPIDADKKFWLNFFNDRLTYLTEKMSKINAMIDLGTYCIELEPISGSTCIDSKVRVSKFIWAITLLIYKGGTSKNLENHALFVVEGLNDGYFQEVNENNYFMNRVDYDGQRIVSTLMPGAFLRYTKRSQVWLVTAEKAKEMLENIAAEIPNPPKFCRFGSDSIFSGDGEESCFTWTRKKLKIVDINLGKGVLGKLVTIPSLFAKDPSSYTDLSCFCSVVQDRDTDNIHSSALHLPLQQL